MNYEISEFHPVIMLIASLTSPSGRMLRLETASID